MLSEPDCLEDRTCRWIWDLTGQVWLAEMSQVTLVGLRVLAILAGALVVRWLAVRALRRAVRRAATRERPHLLRTLPGKMLPKQMRSELPEMPSTRKAQRAEAIGSVLRSTVTIAVFSVAGLLVLSEFAINLAPLLAGAGIVGVALGFGAQSLVRDVLSGLFMLLEDQYGMGDLVDLGEASGVVVAMGLRTTTLRDLRGVVWHVPNGEVRRVGNRSHTPAVVVVDIPIGFAPVEQAVVALRTGAQRLAEDPDVAPEIVEPPELLGVDNVTVEGAVFRTIVQTTADGQWHVGRELRRRQAEALEEAGLADQIMAARVYPRELGPPPGGDQAGSQG